MMTRIGLPQGLLHYEFGAAWETFFKALGGEVVRSPASNRAVLELGLAATVDEACLPLKLAVGHVAALRDRCDYVFLPRVVSWRAGEYSCPQLMGLPDVAAAGLGPSLELLSPLIDLRNRPRSLGIAAREAAAPLTSDRRRIAAALAQALRRYAAERAAAARVIICPDAPPADVTVGVTGEPYVIHDPLVSLDLLGQLRRLGARAVFGGIEPPSPAAHGRFGLPRAMLPAPTDPADRAPYWTLCNRSAAAAARFLADPSIAGLIHVESFACGPGALAGELIARRVWRAGTKPLLMLTVDEHTGEAGLITRCEAFLDLIRWRRSR